MKKFTTFMALALLVVLALPALPASADICTVIKPTGCPPDPTPTGSATPSATLSQWGLGLGKNMVKLMTRASSTNSPKVKSKK